MKLPDHYVPARGLSPGTQGFSVWETSREADAFWDDQLEGSSLGQFQQSSAWGRAKRLDGWQVSRYVFESQGRVLGGFQLLWKRRKWLKIGYVSKGPVLFHDDFQEWDEAIGSAAQVARQRGLAGLILQLPDQATRDEGIYARHGFQRETLMGVMTASLWFDLAGGEPAIWARMPGYNRTFIRQAQRRGVSVREGAEADLGLFFDLMLQTCRRQETSPNPGSEALLRKVWSVFAERSSIRLTLAEVQGKVVAAIISLKFGRRLILWKKGWTNDHSNCRPNHLLYFESLRWAQEKGLEFCDFFSLRRDIAEVLLAGGELNPEQAASRDKFHLGFGGLPKLQPPSMLYIPNPLFRIGYPLLQRLAGYRSRFRRASSVTTPAATAETQT